MLRDQVDFSFSSSYDPTSTTIYSIDGSGNPTEYELEKTVQAQSGQILSQQFTIGNASKFLTLTIDDSKITIIKLENDLSLAQKEITDMNTRLSSAEATWQMAENLYRQLADQVREHSYDIKDLNR